MAPIADPLEVRTYGQLTVKELLPDRIDHKKVYLCQCTCGKELKVIGRNLRNGTRTSCGCHLFLKPGQRFGRWIVIEKVANGEHGDRRYKVICDCGNEGDRSTYQLTSGTSQSCGCLQRESAERKIEPGTKIDKLTVIGATGERRHLGIVYRCVCECGKERELVGSVLRSGRFFKCCGSKECKPLRWNIRPGPNNEPSGSHSLYSIWCGIKSRTDDPNNAQWDNYGGRGITFHSEWSDDPWKFYEDIETSIGKRPSPKHSLDRIDNDGSYVPGNLRWATQKMQSANQRHVRSNAEVDRLKKENDQLRERLAQLEKVAS